MINYCFFNKTIRNRWFGVKGILEERDLRGDGPEYNVFQAVVSIRVDEVILSRRE